MNAVSCILYLSCYLAIIAVYCASLIANAARSPWGLSSCAYLLLGMLIGRVTEGIHPGTAGFSL